MHTFNTLLNEIVKVGILADFCLLIKDRLTP